MIIGVFIFIFTIPLAFIKLFFFPTSHWFMKLVFFVRTGSPQGVWGTSPYWDPQSGEPMLGTQAPRMPGFEGQWDLLPGDPGAVGNRDSTLKQSTQYLTCSGTQGRSTNLKGAWWNLMTERVFQRGSRQLKLTLGTQTVAAAILGGSFYYLDTGAGKFGTLPLPYNPRTQSCCRSPACRQQC